jgi:N-acetylglucosamine kinase-like BadF-type ATPase
MSGYKAIADSGSTKTDWVIVDREGNQADRVKTIGFNPYFQSSEFILAELQRSFSKSKINSNELHEVNFYGAGCSSIEKNAIVEQALSSQFPKAQINVDHDLVAAARATLGNESGIAGILGTGSNSCVWENGKVVHNIPSHGYIFGDEGSGSYLGIRLVQRYLEDNLETRVKQDFEKKFKLTKDQILNATYKEKDPNVFLASFASFYYDYLDQEPFRRIIRDGFVAFFEKRIQAYPNYSKYDLGFVGSIAYFYQDILSDVAQERGMTIRKITRCPIDTLVEFHTHNQVVKSI